MARDEEEWLGGRLAREALDAGEPAAWFEPLYAAAEQGDTDVPWDGGAPNRWLVAWAEARGLQGDGRRAIVVGSGLGDDAEFVAGRGFSTVAFDVAPTAARLARGRFPDTRVDYRAADLLELPMAWRGAFDLVVEIRTVQSLPSAPRPAAIAAIRGLVAPGGTALVIAAARHPGDPDAGPPWPLTRPEIESFAAGDLRLAGLEEPRGDDGFAWWVAELRRG